MNYKLNDSFDTTFNLTYLYRRYKTTKIKSLHILPNLSASLNLNYKIIDPLSLNTNIRYIGRHGMKIVQIMTK